MIKNIIRIALYVLILSLGFLGNLQAVSAKNAYILNLTDIHFDPFYDTTIVPELIKSDVSKWDKIFQTSKITSYGSYTADTNYNLFASSLKSMKKNVEHPDFILFTGDFICHDFSTKFSPFNKKQSAEHLHAFIFKTVEYVVFKLGEIYPKTPFYFTLGNDDSYIGDYQVEPKGSFLKDTSQLFYDKIFFNGIIQKNEFKSSYGYGGYYSAAVPNIENAEIIVLNSIFYTAGYQYNGKADSHPGDVELNWLEEQLEKAQKQEKRVWLLTHVPLGIDVYSTLAEPQNSSGRITGAPVLYRMNDFNRRFVELIRKYHENIEVIFVGHTHMDWFELYNDTNGEYIAFNHLSPAISPVYGNNPAYQVVYYDKKTFKLTDYSVFYLNLDKANAAPDQADVLWKKEYTFTEAYSAEAYNLNSLIKVYSNMIDDDSVSMKNFVDFYTVKSTAQVYINSHNWFNFYLAVGRLQLIEFMKEMKEEL